MNRLTNNDRNFGPLTLGRWHQAFSAYINSRSLEGSGAYLMLTAFGWAFRLRVFSWMCQPRRARWVECNWDAETVKRLGCSGYWETHERRFGFSLSDMGNGYDFLQCFFGPQTLDSSTTKSWSKHLPWKQWDHVRHSLYTPTGEHFYTQPRGADYMDFFEKKDECPKVHFRFEDCDGELIVATCCIEEREWRKGSGWFRWLRRFSTPKVCRSLDLAFSAEVGPGKGSWKGGTIGHGIDMLPGESPKEAFQRYCSKSHERKGQQYSLRFIGPCDSPRPNPSPSPNAPSLPPAG